MLARAHHFFVFVTVADKARRLERAVDAVAGVAQAGNDVGGLIEMVVDGARINMYAGVLFGQRLETLGRGDDAQHADVLDTALAQVADGHLGRTARGEHVNMVQVYIKGQEDKELSSFLRYYPVRIKNIGMDAFFDRQVIYDFKDGRNHADVAKCVAKMLVKKFGRKVRSVVSSCVPASSQERNEARNKNFSELVCKFSGAINGFSHVKVVGERTAVHGTKVKKEERAKRLKEKNNIEVDANFFKNKIVCIWDDVVTTGTSFCAYTAQLEQVGAHVTNGIFLGKTSYNLSSG